MHSRSARRASARRQAGSAAWERPPPTSTRPAIDCVIWATSVDTRPARIFWRYGPDVLIGESARLVLLGVGVAGRDCRRHRERDLSGAEHKTSCAAGGRLDRSGDVVGLLSGAVHDDLVMLEEDQLSWHG